MSPLSEYDEGWMAWIDGQECPTADASDQCIKGFTEASWEYPAEGGE